MLTPKTKSGVFYLIVKETKRERKTETQKYRQSCVWGVGNKGTVTGVR